MKPKPLGKCHSLKPRRVKAFKSCWTCRNRKVSCDLQKPACNRCIRSGLKCAGYDINLIWTKPSQFDEYGIRTNMSDERISLGAAVPFKKSHHQRRTIELMPYTSENTNVEDVEKELAQLDNLPQEKIEASKPWMFKRFGVFQAKTGNQVGTDGKKEESVVLNGVENANETGNDLSASRTNLNPQKVLVSNYPCLSNPLGSNWPHDLNILGDKAQGLEWFAAELRDDVHLSTLALQTPGYDTTQTGIFEEVGFDDPLFRFLNPNNGKASTIDLEARNGDEPVVASSTNTDNRQTSLSRENGGKAPVNTVNDRGNDNTNPFDSLTQKNTGDNRPSANSQSDNANPRSATEVISLHLKDEEVLKSLNAFNPWFRIPETGYYIHGLTRLLLNHYMDTVADKMIVVTVPKNPWRTMYFSRVLNALGDLTGLGHTSHSRNSLLNAILALSCFHLLNKFPKASTQQTFFLNLGIDFRRQASRFLKLCLQSSVDKEKYKDVLIAIISLSSVDVVWGTMTNCGYYLEVCEGFIETRVKNRPTMSKKAKALHSIFSFLKLIQDSTSLDRLDESEIPSTFGNECTSLPSHPDNCDSNVKPSRFCFQTSINDQDGRISTLLVEGREITLSQRLDTVVPLFIHVEPESYYLSENKLPEANMLGPDALYGLPNSLIFMFADCIKIVKYIHYFKTKNSFIPIEFQRLLSDFEEQLKAWRPEWKFHQNESADIFVNDTVEGVYHHSMSFYYGLLIYFFTMVRSSELAPLQGYAEKALAHLMALSRLREEKGVKVLPLMWQGFIAGCASISEDIQREFRSWAANFAQNGMGSYWGARQVMFEVWKRMEQGHPNDSWYFVYKDWSINLMLF